MRQREKSLLKRLLSRYIKDASDLNRVLREISQQFDVNYRGNKDVEEIIVSPLRKGDRVDE